ncbi:MAG TPA: LpxD N-terminal domain-containing protein, partial [Chitinophagaceae bacterium]
MRFDKPQAVREIAEYIHANIIGNENGVATGINEIHRVEQGDIVFVDHPKYYSTCVNSAATVIIIDQETSFPEGKTLLVTSEPFEAYLSLVDHFRPFQPSSKLISDTASVGEGTVVMPGCYIGHHVKIGANCIIGPHVSILDYSVIGDNVIIQAGTVIGSDAFYYNRKTT